MSDLETTKHALAQAVENQSRDSDTGLNTGGLNLNRLNGRDAFGAVVAQLLLENGGTVVWDMDCPTSGSAIYNTFYEYCAALAYAPGGTLREKIEAAQEYASEIRSGFVSLSKWSDVQYGIPLFRCTGPGSGNKITTITMDPEHVIDERTGETALHRQVARDKKAVEGQVHAAYARLGRSCGEQHAVSALKHALGNILAKPLPEPRQNLPLFED